MEIKELYNKFLESEGIATDTRTIEKGVMFFALKGDNFNGNKYAKQAIENGASFAVIDEKEYCINNQYILVDNVLSSLQDLAKHHRAQFKIPIIGITGTNGKTTTKELIKILLSTKFNTFATKGNFNNHIGVPLSLLSITNETEIAIIEMGANHIGEIESYCEWVKPTLGIITNIGHAHLEGFGSFENIIKAKNELYKELMKSNKIIFYNDDDDLIITLLEKYEYKISYGANTDVDTRIRTINSFPTLEIEFEEQKIRTNLFGEYNTSNISAAISIASYFDIPINSIKLALEKYNPTNNRSQIKQLDTNIIILDAYNANPTSVKAVMNSFEKLTVTDKVLILGDMFELGEDSVKLHQEIVTKAEQSEIPIIVFVGGIYNKCNSTKDFIFLKETTDAISWFKKQNFHHSTILIKGSRGMKMETIIE